MEPLTAILVGLGVKAGSNMIDGITRWFSQRDQQESLHATPGGAMQPYVGSPRAEFYSSRMVSITIEFGTDDPAVFELIDEENPALLVMATPDAAGEPLIDVVPCAVSDTFVIDLPAGEAMIAVLVFHDELVDEDGDPVLVAWQQVDAVLYEDEVVHLPIRVDEDFLELLEALSGEPVCDWCWAMEDRVTSSWTVDDDGDFRCNACGSFNDFHECTRCGGLHFRRTRKGNYRCIACDKKVVP